MFPRVNIKLDALTQNASILRNYLEEKGISTVAVTKVFGADRQLVEAYHKGGITQFADARIENLRRIDQEYGTRMLLRIPMLSEVPDVVRYSDSSLQSELIMIEAIDQEAGRQGVRHQIILMVDLGDLREGIFYEKDLYDIAARIVQLENLDWIGLGTNLTCYGGVLPTDENLNRLADLAEGLRGRFGIELPVLSGGNSSSLYVTERTKNPRWNQLRIGEALALGTEAAFGERFIGLNTDAFTLEAEIIERKIKPSVPIGQVEKNAFGESPVFLDRGDRVRLIVAVGRQDVDADDLVPEDPCLEILGASSDHMILDAGDCIESGFQVGDTIRFSMNYRAVLRAFTSAYVSRNYI